MEKHITLVGVLNIVYRSLAIIGAIVLFTLAYGFRYFIEYFSRFDHHGMHEIPQPVFEIVPIILTIIGICILILSIAGIIGAIGVLKRKEWGRITLLVISFFNLVRFPLGTVLGIYSIWVLLNDEIIQIFNPISNPTIEKK
jgi:hypothetical protein